MAVSPSPTIGITTTKVEPNEIGWMFVPQFYTFVNKEPSRLHCFYTKKSTLIHGTEGEECLPKYGQQEIHDKIMSLDFLDCKVYVSQVDSQSSTDGGIIVQVLGEMSNKGQRWRKFAQTFFLAEQPTGYFVLNDIFRYLKEDADSEDHDHEADQDVPAGADLGSPQPLQIQQNGVTKSFETVEVPTNFTTPTYIGNRTTDRQTAELQQYLASQHIHIDREPPVQQPNGFYSSAATDSAISERSASPQPNRVNETSSLEQSIISEAPEPVPSEQASPTISHRSEVSVKHPQPATEPAASQPVEKPAEITPPASASAEIESSAVSSPPIAVAAPPAPASNAPRSWANLAAASSKNARGVATFAPSVAANTSVATSSGPPSVSGGSERGQASTSRDVKANHVGWVTSAPLVRIADVTTPNTFIKGITNEHDPRELRDTLVRKFGPLRELDVHPSKNCAFAEFNSVESARKAIQYCFAEPFGGQGGLVCGNARTVLVLEPKKLKVGVDGAGGQRRGAVNAADPSTEQRNASRSRPNQSTAPAGNASSSRAAQNADDDASFTPAREHGHRKNISSAASQGAGKSQGKAQRSPSTSQGTGQAQSRTNK